MQSSRTSDRLRLQRAISDPWGLVLALSTGVLAVAFGWGFPVLLLAPVAVLLVRLGAEYTIPRGERLEAADVALSNLQSVTAALDATATSLGASYPAPIREGVGRIRRLCLDVLKRSEASHSPREVFTVVRTAVGW